MKKHILLLVALSGLTISCSKLEESVYSSIFTTNFYKTASDAEAGIASASGSLINLYGFPLVAVSDFAADQAYPRAVVGRNTITLFSYDPYFTAQRNSGRHETEGPQGVWRFSYKGIENANWIIEKVPAIQMDAQRRTEIVAEAYALRGLYHWTLTKTFNEVPVKMKASTSEAEALSPKSYHSTAGSILNSPCTTTKGSVVRGPLYPGRVSSGWLRTGRIYRLVRRINYTK